MQTLGNRMISHKKTQFYGSEGWPNRTHNLSAFRLESVDKPNASWIEIIHSLSCLK